MINQTIAEDIEFNNLSLEAQLVYLRIIPHLDRDGLINGHHAVLWGKVAPLLPDLLSVMPKLIDEMVDAGLIIRYIANKTSILFFKGFNKNQIGMRYEREPSSLFPVPPGYKRTNAGLARDDKSNNPPPPSIDEPPQTPPPPTNGTVPHEEAERDSFVPHTSGNVPTDIRQTSGNVPADCHLNRIEENRREEKATGATQSVLPVLASSSGVVLPSVEHRNNTRGKVAEHMKAARELGLSPEQFRLNTDTLLAGFGKTALVDAGDDVALNHAQELTLTMARMGEQFKTIDGLNSVFDSWKANDYRGDTTPSSTQYKEHASLMVAGKVVCNRKEMTKPVTTGVIVAKIGELER